MKNIKSIVLSFLFLCAGSYYFFVELQYPYSLSFYAGCVFSLAVIGLFLVQYQQQTSLLLPVYIGGILAALLDAMLNVVLTGDLFLWHGMLLIACLCGMMSDEKNVNKTDL
jgi:hypothetical protein